MDSSNKLPRNSKKWQMAPPNIELNLKKSTSNQQFQQALPISMPVATLGNVCQLELSFHEHKKNFKFFPMNDSSDRFLRRFFFLTFSVTSRNLSSCFPHLWFHEFQIPKT